MFNLSSHVSIIDHATALTSTSLSKIKCRRTSTIMENLLLNRKIQDMASIVRTSENLGVEEFLADSIMTPLAKSILIKSVTS